jgi:peptide/nickel transport system substrate-binding protein
VLVCLLACCNSAPPATGVVTLAVLSSPNSLDPRVGSDETSQRAHQLLFDNLLSLDEQLRVTGGLASGFEQRDPLTYDVFLRQGVMFHDGHELTADDVVVPLLHDPSFICRARALTDADKVGARRAVHLRFARRSHQL